MIGNRIGISSNLECVGTINFMFALLYYILCIFIMYAVKEIEKAKLFKVNLPSEAKRSLYVKRKSGEIN